MLQLCPMQTILGANGGIGQALARALAGHTDKIRLVSRNPKPVNPGDELMPLDLMQRDNVFAAVKGSEVAYLCVGLKYDINVWRRDWPVLMRNVLDACAEYNCKLVFVDNVYAIDAEHIGHITETSPMKPCSKKGEVRRQIDQMILDEVSVGRVDAIIARCADYYGPAIEQSLVMISTWTRMSKGKNAQWMGYPEVPHTYTYTEDAGRGLAALGNATDTWNQVWNLPTDSRGFTGRDWINLVAAQLGKSNRFSNMGPGMVRFLGMFVPILKEIVEMSYQFRVPYFLDSSKFERRFGWKATPYEIGMAETIKKLQASKSVA